MFHAKYKSYLSEQVLQPVTFNVKLLFYFYDRIRSQNCKMISVLKQTSHHPIITESEVTQSVVQSNEICSDCFGSNVRSHCLIVGPNFTVTVKNYPDRPNKSDMSDYPRSP